MKIAAKESDIQKGIMDLLAAKRTYAIRFNTGGGRVKGQWMHFHSAGKGLADILAFPIVRCPNGNCDVRTSRQLWIEVKRAGSKPSPEQYSFGSHVTDLGHFYLVASSIEDVSLWLDEHS